MSANVATLPTRTKSVTIDMADRFGMEPKAFEATLRATVFPATARAEEFAAFLLVAKHYNLNPITKEIYAFPKKGGGIQPIVSIDGWMNLINSHPAMDGIEFDDLHEEGKLVAITCRIFRKDRSRPITVTEYLIECERPTDPWKMKHRMLRHKSAIQCARYAFGFAGIVDPDEAERMPDVVAPRLLRDATPPSPPMITHVAEPPPAGAPESPAAVGELAPQEIASAIVEEIESSLNEEMLDHVLDAHADEFDTLPRELFGQIETAATSKRDAFRKANLAMSG
ncbi:phage recombination protein Bet [Rhizobiales bacterium GAS113]|nr:phage recombination protein Bet [Rhizobiales bacterium GAS113]